MLFFFSFKSSGSDYCDYLSGLWGGVYQYDNTPTQYRSYMYPNGNLEIVFKKIENDVLVKKEKYTGSWSCKSNIIRTKTTDERSVTRRYKYNILTANSTYMKYQIFSKNKVGFIFENMKLSEL